MVCIYISLYVEECIYFWLYEQNVVVGGGIESMSVSAGLALVGLLMVVFNDVVADGVLMLSIAVLMLVVLTFIFCFDIGGVGVLMLWWC